MGTEDFELLVRNNTEVIVYGKYCDPLDEELTPVRVHLQNLVAYIDRKVTFEGYIKTPLGRFQTSDSVFVSGSICDGYEHKVEIKSNLVDNAIFKSFQKGDAVIIIGKVKKYGTYPPFVQLSSQADLIACSDKFRLEFQKVLKCYTNV